MKLYATVQSERASKGQGGNKFIRIQLTVGDKANQINAGLIELRYIELKGQLNSYDQVDVMYFEPEKNGVYRLINEIKVPKKGKRQKGEDRCPNDNTKLETKMFDIDGTNLVEAEVCPKCKYGTPALH